MDLYPQKAQFLTGEDVRLLLEIGDEACARVEVTVFRMERAVHRRTISSPCGTLELSVGQFDTPFSGYGVSAVAFLQSGSVLLETAFDVVDNPKKSLRYGFLSDFEAADADNGAIQWLNKCHINLVQYYDWSYRHDALVTQEDFYYDMMGKPIFRKTVTDKIADCTAHAMHAVAYGAVYAASKPFFQEHPSWALYNSCQKPFVFIDVFYIMNPAKDSPWRAHLIAEYRKAMCEMGFSGIHMDTYGFPKTAYSHLDSEPKLVRLDEVLASLIEDCGEQLPNCAYLIFNNVGAWPTYATASAPQDAVYIEVWPPYERYSHIAQIIGEARQLAGSGKPIILAAYLSPFRTEPRDKAMNAARLLTAAIVSNGAYHLLTGENRAVLTQGYYSDYTRLHSEEAAVLRRYYDFLVRYLELFYDPDLKTVSMTHQCWDNYEYQCLSQRVSAYGEAGRLWLIIREKDTRKCLHFVNLCGCTDENWNKGKDTPIFQKDISIRVQIDRAVSGIFTASPDDDSMQAQALPYRICENEKGQFVDFVLPSVKFWTAVWLELPSEETERGVL